MPPVQIQMLGSAVVVAVSTTSASAQLTIIDSTMFVETRFQIDFVNPNFPPSSGNTRVNAPSINSFHQFVNSTTSGLGAAQTSQDSEITNSGITTIGISVVNDNDLMDQIMPESIVESVSVSAESFFSVTFQNAAPFHYDLDLWIFAAETANPMEAHASLISLVDDVIFDYTTFSNEKVLTSSSGILPPGTWTLEAWIQAEGINTLETLTNGGGLFDIRFVPSPATSSIAAMCFVPLLRRKRMR